MNLHDIFDDCGLAVGRYEAVQGGDINRSWCLHSNGATYFLKVNDAARYPGMFYKEVHGLQALREACMLKVPEVIKYGEVQGQQYLLMEWLEKGNMKYGMWQRFGRALAEMHKQPQPFFGWHEDNYIGSLVQVNTRCETWPDFYAVHRIMPLVKRLLEQDAITLKDVHTAELLCSNLHLLFPGEPPALLHGDLWAGNYMVLNTGDAALYDPAVYFGHREMDVAMTALFGGFDASFYDAYNEVYPLAAGWQQRLRIAQLYPLLVHAVLFGGHYVEEVRGIWNSD